VIQRQPYAQQRFDTNAQIKREGLDIKQKLGQGNIGVKQESNEIKRNLGTESNAIKNKDVDSKIDTRAGSLGIRQEGNVIKQDSNELRRASDAAKIEQKDRHLDFLREKQSQNLDQRKVEALSKESGHNVGQVVKILQEKVRQGVPWSPKEQSYMDALRERSRQMGLSD
jgi:hypothetical protein